MPGTRRAGSRCKLSSEPSRSHGRLLHRPTGPHAPGGHDGRKSGLLAQQRRWAEASGLAVVAGYLRSVPDNLCRGRLSHGGQARVRARARGGTPRPPRPPREDGGPGLVIGARGERVRSLGGGAATCADRHRPRDSTTRRPTRRSRRSSRPRSARPPTLDLALRLEDGTTVGVESKFSEWMTSGRGRRPRSGRGTSPTPKAAGRRWAFYGVRRSRPRWPPGPRRTGISTWPSCSSTRSASRPTTHTQGRSRSTTCTSIGHAMPGTRTAMSWAARGRSRHEISFRSHTYQATYQRLERTATADDPAVLRCLAARYFDRGASE